MPCSGTSSTGAAATAGPGHEISSALGVTKQAVHKRFAVGVAAHIVAATPAPTFERFTDRARTVLAAPAGRGLLGADAVGTEHMLLALFAEPEPALARPGHLAAMGVEPRPLLRTRATSPAGQTDRSQVRPSPGRARARPRGRSGTEPSKAEAAGRAGRGYGAAV